MSNPKLSDKVAALILVAVGQARTVDPVQALPMVEKALTSDEQKQATAFLAWCYANERTFTTTDQIAGLYGDYLANPEGSVEDKVMRTLDEVFPGRLKGEQRQKFRNSLADLSTAAYATPLEYEALLGNAVLMVSRLPKTSDDKVSIHFYEGLNRGEFGRVEINGLPPFAKVRAGKPDPRPAPNGFDVMRWINVEGEADANGRFEQAFNPKPQ